MGTLKLPKLVNEIMARFKTCGYEIYVVGGVIRDFYLGKQPDDYDLVSNASISTILSLFPEYHNINENGQRHGTITFHTEIGNIEISSFHGNTLAEDLQYRDLNVNAIAFDGTDFIDPRNGIQDIENHKLSMGEDPNKIIEDDPLRILRVLRFHAETSFEIAPKTKSAICLNAQKLGRISKERITSELRKILLAPDIGLLLDKYRVIFGTLFPDLAATFDFDQHNPWHAHDLYTHTFYVVQGTPARFRIRIAALFHDLGKVPCRSIEWKSKTEYAYHFYGHPASSASIAEPILSEYRFGNQEIAEILFLITNHDNEIPLTPKAVKKVLAKIDTLHADPIPLLEDLLDLQISDHLDHTTVTPIHKAETLALAKEILAQKEAFTIRQLAINGDDLLNLGFHGKEIGDVLKNVLNLVIEEKLQNKREVLLNYALSLKAN